MSTTQIKTPKGTRDWAEDDLILRNAVFAKIRRVFELHGGAEIDTPVFELKSYLTDNYGEDTKLIYNLQERGGELCALRYDLTVPFARWLAMGNIRHIKRFQIGKVYRRDQPAVSRGRMREFFQCDFDYAGEFDSMVPDAEVVSITAEVFEALDLPVTIRINHRLILDGLFSALDKLPWDEVQKEMETKGLDASVATKLGGYVLLGSAGEFDLAASLEMLKSDPLLLKNADIQKGVEEVELLLQYLNAYGVATYVKFDLSLARGLDYYTGLIYEVVLDDEGTEAKLQVGSVAAGGRYDSLVGKFSSRDIPCVGISFGIDRILTVLKARQEANLKPQTSRRLDVWIIIASSNTLLVEQRIVIARELRQADISVDFDAKADKKPRKQMDVAKKSASVVVFLEYTDVSPGGIRVKTLALPEKNLDNATAVDRKDLVCEVKKRLA
ncbi:histidyl-tRNA synthetase [Decorospora gaudefroyi]|uniref:histidine--tRNA ligase n=1 Tax=Decorospora gaudefroyi TaxID=184978 RepID=A0A6A5KE77_9PLEO|nr:histidyl-tRNA synthetase [Decorospora gaudefroyi]